MKKKSFHRFRLCLRKNWRRRPLFTFICLAGLTVIVGISMVSASCRLAVKLNSRGRVFEKAEEVPATPVAVVLGAGWMRRKRPFSKKFVKNEAFYYRIDAAAELYKKGRVRHIICSGSSQPANNYDEIPVMRVELIRRGVPDDAISADPYGWRTLDSIIRLKTIWGLDKAVVVSQRYHVERAIFQGDHHNVKIIGYAAKSGPFVEQLRGNFHRESLALIKLMLDIYITDAGPIFPDGAVDPEEKKKIAGLVLR